MLLLASLAVGAPLYRYDLDTSDGGFLAEGEVGQWQWGEVRNGPGAGYDGPNAWSTGLAADYLNAAPDESLLLPTWDLDGLDRPMLRFDHWYAIDGGDAGWVEVDDGSGWRVLEPVYGYPDATGYTGTSDGWEDACFDLGGLGPSPALRLVFSTDLSGVSDGWTVDAVAVYDGDVAAPAIASVTALSDTDDLEGPYAVEAVVQDDVGVSSVVLAWETVGGAGRVEMSLVGGDTWAGAIPAQPPDTVVSYRVEASDGTNTRTWPTNGALSFRVYLPAPTGLSGPDGRVVATEAGLTWDPPVGRNPALSYEVLRDGLVVVASEGTEATVPLAGVDDRFAVRAVYAAGAGDLSDPIDIDAVVPAITGLSPAEGWPEDTLRIALTGTYLLLVEGEVTADLGAGVSVEGVEVRDVDSAWLDVVIDAAATPGTRDLALVSGNVSVSAPAAFEVLDPADHPALLSIEPDTVRQGESGTLILTHSGALAAAPEVDLGDGVVVGAVTWGDGEVRVEYTVTGDAPLGARAVRLDDGARLLEGVSIEVRDAYAGAIGGCGTPVAPGGVLALVGLVAAVGRARLLGAGRPSRGEHLEAGEPEGR